MLHDDIKAAVDSNDVMTLKYSFCDCLDGDPTFESYKEDFEYCRSKGVLFEPHQELSPMTLERVNEAYWVQLKKDFMANPSVERLEHMRKAAAILYRDRILRSENSHDTHAQTAASTVQTAPVRQPESTQNGYAVKEATFSELKTDEKRIARDGTEPVIRRAAEPVGQYAGNGVRRASEPIGGVYSPSQNRDQNAKKALGAGCAAIAAVIVIAAIIALAFIIRLL